MGKANDLVGVPDLQFLNCVVVDDPLNQLKDSLKELQISLSTNREALGKGSLAELREYLQHEAPIVCQVLKLGSRFIIFFVCLLQLDLFLKAFLYHGLKLIE